MDTWRCGVQTVLALRLPDASIRNYTSTDRRINVIDDVRIADLVINAGLIRWLINKRS